MALPPVLRHRDFNLCWFGVVFSQIGTRGTVAANLFQIYELTKSIPMTGLVGHVFASALLTMAAAEFDQPARQTLIPAMVPRAELPQAFSLRNPSREVAILISPALTGILIAVESPALMSEELGDGEPVMPPVPRPPPGVPDEDWPEDLLSPANPAILSQK